MGDVFKDIHIENIFSLTIVKPPAGADVGFLGVGTDDPQEMAHVVDTLLIENLIFTL
jgi:hypothetical protein